MIGRYQAQISEDLVPAIQLFLKKSRNVSIPDQWIFFLNKKGLRKGGGGGGGTLSLTK